MRSLLISVQSRCSQRSPSHQRFPWALQLKEQILKEQITDDRVFFKMPFLPCPLGCGRFLSADDGHDRCLQCLGLQHAEAAFVDDSCACCGRMSMKSLRSRLSFLKGLAPSAATRPSLSGSSRGPPVGALRDLRITVRASTPGTSPRTSYSSRSERHVRLPGDFAGSSHGAPPEDRMLIAASGDGLTSSEDEGSAGLPPSGVVDTAAPDPELTAMLARAAASIGKHFKQPSIFGERRVPCVRAGLLSRCPETPAWIRAQGSHHALPWSGGEPASTAFGGGRSSLGVAVSRKSIAHIRGLHPELQKLWAALCLPRRSAEREGCLQAEVGPLDSGCHRLGVPIPRRAVPPGGEGSLHTECCLLLCVGARRLSGRHL